MASSSKNIKMPLVFGIAIASVLALAASVIFGLAWYEYQASVTLRDQVLTEPTHSTEYLTHDARQQSTLDQAGTTEVNLGGRSVEVKTKMTIDQAMQQFTADQAQQGQ